MSQGALGALKSAALPAAAAFVAGVGVPRLVHQHRETVRQLQEELGQAKRDAEVQRKLLTAQLQQSGARLQAQADQAKAEQARLEAQLAQADQAEAEQAQAGARLAEAETKLQDAIAKLQASEAQQEKMSQQLQRAKARCDEATTRLQRQIPGRAWVRRLQRAEAQLRNDGVLRDQRAAELQLAMARLAQSRAQLSKAMAVLSKAFFDRQQLEVKVLALQLKTEANLKAAKAQQAQGAERLQQAEARERKLLRVQQQLRDKLAARQPDALATQLEQMAAQLAESQRQLQQAEARLDAEARHAPSA